MFSKRINPFSRTRVKAACKIVDAQEKMHMAASFPGIIHIGVDNNIRIYHKCEGGIEKVVPHDHPLSSLGKNLSLGITVCHHSAKICPSLSPFAIIQQESVPRDHPLSSLGKNLSLVITLCHHTAKICPS